MFTTEPFTAHRRVVHDLLQRARDDHATVSGCFEWDFTDTRAALQARRAEKRTVSLAAYMVKATALTLRRHPSLNARLFSGIRGKRIVRWDQVSCNLLMARRGLDGEMTVFPLVIRDADTLTVEEIDGEIDAVRDAKAKDLPQLQALVKLETTPRPLVMLHQHLLRTNPSYFIERYGTYALSVLAHEGLGGVSMTPISPSTTFYPGAQQDKPVVRSGEIVIRRMMTFGMAVDHFVVDGMEVMRGARKLKRLVEEPHRVMP